MQKRPRDAKKRAKVRVLSSPQRHHTRAADGRSKLIALFCWRPRRDLNPCYRRERADAHYKSMTYVALQGGFGAQNPPWKRYCCTNVVGKSEPKGALSLRGA